jgi:hypothetical protein
MRKEGLIQSESRLGIFMCSLQVPLSSELHYYGVESDHQVRELRSSSGRRECRLLERVDSRSSSEPQAPICQCDAPNLSPPTRWSPNRRGRAMAPSIDGTERDLDTEST